MTASPDLPAAAAPQLREGDYAPDFVLPDHEGIQVALPSYRGKRVVLWFPRALERAQVARDFQAALSELRDADVDVLLVAPDGVEDLHGFVAEHGLSFPVLADPGLTVHYAYGAYQGSKEEAEQARNRRGATDPAADRRVVRTTVVVGPRGDVERAYYDVRNTDHVAEVLRDLGVRR